MKENSWKKWLYWFSFGVAIIIVFNIFNNFDNLKQIIGNFFQILSPFLAGILIAYILYLPSRRIEKLLEKVKLNLLKIKQDQLV